MKYHRKGGRSLVYMDFVAITFHFYKVYFSFDIRDCYYLNQKWVQTFCTLWVHKGEGVRIFEFFPMHQFCQERTLILRQFCSTRLPRWRFCGLPQRYLEQTRTNKRKWSLKKWRNQAKLNVIAEDFCFNKFVKFTICLYSRLRSSVLTIFF